jgi:hypothetical protein|tara:strand:- start:97 stop:279 length:183 start_codon:yes stop_codon:yes gene_type:complete
MKEFWKSKTIILAALQILVGVLLFISNQVEIGAAVTLKGIADIALRLATKEAVVILDIEK